MSTLSGRRGGINSVGLETRIADLSNGLGLNHSSSQISRSLRFPHCDCGLWDDTCGCAVRTSVHGSGLRESVD